jgi:hypothetical protein
MHCVDGWGLIDALQIRVKLGVMLRENEKMVKVMRFCINEPEVR